MRIRRVRGGQALNVLGIDPSLTSTGYAYYHEGKLVTGRIRPGTRKGTERLVYCRDQFIALVEKVQPTLVSYENYSYGSARKRASFGNFFDIGELGGVYKTWLWENGFDVLLVPPSNMKQFITGSGAAKKEAVPIAIRKMGYDIKQNDEADAFGMLQMGIAFADRRHVEESIRYYASFRALGGCSLSPGRKK